MWEAKQKLRLLAIEWLLPSTRMKRRIGPPLIGLAYIALIYFLGGLKSDHVLIGMLGFLDAYNEKTRLFLRFFLPFILTGVVYDSMRYFYWQGINGHVHVAEPYYRDLKWFGFDDGGRRVTPNEYFAAHPSFLLDLFCGFAYLVFVAEYLATAFCLFFMNEWRWLRLFGWAFFTVNVMGFATYFVYPAAPPWYVTQYGLGAALAHISPSSAAAHRFDLIFGTHFFDGIYGRGIDVYGAYPSLHVTYPFLVAWVTRKIPGLRWATIPAIAFYFLMCLSALYLQHHYVVDILLGTLYAVMTLFLMTLLFEEPAALERVALSHGTDRAPVSPH